MSPARGKTLLVDAVSASAAWRHVANRYVKQDDIITASPKRVAELMTAGAKIETVAD